MIPIPRSALAAISLLALAGIALPAAAAAAQSRCTYCVATEADYTYNGGRKPWESEGEAAARRQREVHREYPSKPYNPSKKN